MSTGMRWCPDLGVGHVYHLQILDNQLLRESQRRRARATTA
jgi:hypothetical protein